MDNLVAGCLVAILAIVLVVFLLGLQIVVVAGLAMLFCNWVLPMFDVLYPITFMQGCGVGIGFIILRALFGTNVTVKK